MSKVDELETIIKRLRIAGKQDHDLVIWNEFSEPDSRHINITFTKLRLTKKPTIKKPIKNLSRVKK